VTIEKLDELTKQVKVKANELKISQRQQRVSKTDVGRASH